MALPEALAIGDSAGSTLLLAHAGLFLSGMLVGYFKPERPWRWALCTIGLFPALEFIALTRNYSGDLLSFLQISLPYLVVKLPIYLLQTLPALIGAYLGAFCRVGTSVVKLNTIKSFARVGALGFGLALAVGVISLFITNPHGTVLQIWAVASFIFGAVLGVLESNRPWRGGISVGLGIPTAVIIKIIIDVVQRSSSHNMFPLEIFISILIAIPVAILGSCSGAAIKKIFSASKV